LGAILCGFLWTAVDVSGIESPWFRRVRTPVDGCGHVLEIYGSEGWGVRVPPGVLQRLRATFAAATDSANLFRACQSPQTNGRATNGGFGAGRVVRPFCRRRQTAPRLE